MRVANFTAIVVCAGKFMVSSEYVDCFVDTSDRIMTFSSTDPKMTVSTCEQECAPGLFGLQYSTECWCGNGGDYERYGPSEECNIGCGGDPNETCGGSYAMSVYRSNAVATSGGACGVVYEVPTSCPDDQGCSQHFFCGNTDAHTGDGCLLEYGTCASSDIPADDDTSLGTSDTPPRMAPCSSGQFMSCLTHVVLPGPYSSMIAEKYEMTADDLITMNGLGQDGSLIFPHQLLQVKPCRCVEYRSTRRLGEGASRSLRGTSRVLLSEAAGTTLCALNVVSAVTAMGAGIATANPLAIASASIAFANSVSGCESSNDGDWIGRHVDAQVAKEEFVLPIGIYRDNLRSATRTAIESLKDRWDYFTSKSIYMRGQGNRDATPLRSELIALDNPVKSAMNAPWESSTLNTIQIQLAEAGMAMAAMTRLALRQEIVKVTQCKTEVEKYERVAHDVRVYKWATPSGRP